MSKEIAMGILKQLHEKKELTDEEAGIMILLENEYGKYRPKEVAKC